jgi:hypothetical protein
MERKMSDLRPLATTIGIVLMTSLLCGCVGEDNGGTHGTVTWAKPTQVRVEGVSPVEAASAVNLTVRLYDGSNHVSRWDVQLRLIAQDSLGFVMLNITMPIKAGDFTQQTVDNVVDTWYNTSIPFVAFKKSSDKVMGFLTGRMMTVYAWITYEGATYKQSPAPRPRGRGMSCPSTRPTPPMTLASTRCPSRGTGATATPARGWRTRRRAIVTRATASTWSTSP